MHAAVRERWDIPVPGPLPTQIFVKPLEWQSSLVPRPLPQESLGTRLAGRRQAKYVLVHVYEVVRGLECQPGHPHISPSMETCIEGQAGT